MHICSGTWIMTSANSKRTCNSCEHRTGKTKHSHSPTHHTVCVHTKIKKLNFRGHTELTHAFLGNVKAALSHLPRNHSRLPLLAIYPLKAPCGRRERVPGLVTHIPAKPMQLLEGNTQCPIMSRLAF